MVALAPFAAVRFGAPASAGAVLAPPYDVISPARQAALYAQHPHNIVRVDLTRPEPGDDEDARYRRARATLDDWLATGVLVREPAPAFFVLEQSFVGPGPRGAARTRTGFFARVRLARYDERIVLPHERTLSGPKIDRLKLLRATAQNLSPVFSIFRDPAGVVGAALASAQRRAPMLEAALDGVDHQMWRLDDPAAIARITAALADARLYIADGHHRYETALAYRDERRAAGGAGGAYDHVLMFLAPVDDLAIFPTHRRVSGLEGLDEDAFFAALAPFFDVQPAPEALEAALARLAASPRPSFLMTGPTRRHHLVPRPDAPFSAHLAGHSAHLDVAVLHAIVLEHGLGISREAQTEGTRVTYSKDAAEVWAERDPSTRAFVLNATRVEDVLETADAGEVMPEKSTFFYPKVPTGLLLHALDD